MGVNDGRVAGCTRRAAKHGQPAKERAHLAAYQWRKRAPQSRHPIATY